MRPHEFEGLDITGMDPTVDFPAGQVIGHHGVWGAFAFWSPELDAVITGTINTGRVDRRPLLEAVVRALLPPAAARGNRR